MTYHDANHEWIITPGCVCGWRSTETVHSKRAAEEAFSAHLVECIRATERR